MSLGKMLSGCWWPPQEPVATITMVGSDVVYIPDIAAKGETKGRALNRDGGSEDRACVAFVPTSIAANHRVRSLYRCL